MRNPVKMEHITKEREKFKKGEICIWEKRAPVMPEAKKPRLQNEWLLFIIFVSSLFSKRSASKFTATSSIPIAKPPNKSEIKKKIGE